MSARQQLIEAAADGLRWTVWLGLAAGAAAALPDLPQAPLWVPTAGLAGTLTVARVAARRAQRAGRLRVDVDALDAVRRDAIRLGGGAFIGLDELAGGVVHAPAECAALVLAPPRAGKTSDVINPTVLSAPGAVFTASTNPTCS
ncbi:MAG: hypothetical protein ACRDZO_06420 [Egibacteraceae bacterium]